MTDNMEKSSSSEKKSTQKKSVKNERDRRQAELFKRKYFDYYDDIKISVREDW